MLFAREDADNRDIRLVLDQPRLLFLQQAFAAPQGALSEQSAAYFFLDSGLAESGLVPANGFLEEFAEEYSWLQSCTLRMTVGEASALPDEAEPASGGWHWWIQRPAAPEASLPGGADWQEQVLALAADSRLIAPDGERYRLRLLFADRSGIRINSAQSRRSDAHFSAEAIQKRTLRWLGRKNLKRIQEVRLGFVGAGGIGNPAFVQAMHLGFRRFVVADPDRLEEHNCNRFYGARREDSGRFKTRLLEKMLNAFEPEAEFAGVEKAVPDEHALRALAAADILIVAVDNDHARWQAQLFAHALRLPLFDMSSGILLQDADASMQEKPVVDESGGRVRMALPDGPCLVCMGLEAGNPPELERRLRGSGYIMGTDISPPSVITLNSVVASLCIHQLVNFITLEKMQTVLLHYNESEARIYRERGEDLPCCHLCRESGHSQWGS